MFGHAIDDAPTYTAQAPDDGYLQALLASAHFIATRLIRRLQQLAAERGIYVMFVQADQGDAPAIALYRKLGVREDVLHFDIAPTSGADAITGQF